MPVLRQRPAFTTLGCCSRSARSARPSTGSVGLYEGRPVSEQSIWSTGDLPPVISLFRGPLLREWNETGVALEDMVAHVIVHEIGHHFGLSDDQMYAIENEAD